MIDPDKYRPRTTDPGALTCQAFRGRYLCTQCLGERQPPDGHPDADLLFQIGPPGDEETVCRPCAERIAGGEAELTRLVLVVP